jgi:hypothetical protein
VRGKWTIAVILGLALVAGTAAWWQTWSRGRRVLSLWGSQTAYLIRTAPQVDLYRLRADSPTRPSVPPEAADLSVLEVLDHRDITGAPGLTHARQALIEDASYQWTAPISDWAQWQYALKFSSGGDAVTLYFDLQRGVVTARPGGRRKSIRPIAEGLQVFFAEQFDRPSP